MSVPDRRKEVRNLSHLTKFWFNLANDSKFSPKLLECVFAAMSIVTSTTTVAGADGSIKTTTVTQSGASVASQFQDPAFAVSDFYVQRLTRCFSLTNPFTLVSHSCGLVCSMWFLTSFTGAYLQLYLRRSTRTYTTLLLNGCLFFCVVFSCFFPSRATLQLEMLV